MRTAHADDTDITDLHGSLEKIVNLELRNSMPLEVRKKPHANGTRTMRPGISRIWSKMSLLVIRVYPCASVSSVCGFSPDYVEKPACGESASVCFASGLLTYARSEAAPEQLAFQPRPCSCRNRMPLLPPGVLRTG